METTSSLEGSIGRVLGDKLSSGDGRRVFLTAVVGGLSILDLGREGGFRERGVVVDRELDF